ncbi:MAG: HAD-IIIA family hydrolase [Tepidisphaera sp.]|nr:HAD-IIIA family hydrolase [Tepidisphaera sp.]
MSGGSYSQRMKPAVFFDRDDTLMECNSLPAPPPPAKQGDVIDPKLVRVLPGVAAGLESLAQAGFALVVVSNQGVVARGGGTCEQVEAVNDRLREQILLEGGPVLAGMYYCPFHPQGRVPEFACEHEWRKPAPGMLLAAERELGIDLSRSWLVGDATRDIEAGVNAGLAPERCLLIGPEAPFADAGAAASWILSQSGATRTPSTTMSMVAASPDGLSDPGVRATVVATAHGVAERAGVRLLKAAISPGMLEVTIEGGRLACLGLLTEVRRITNHWSGTRGGGPLWAGEEG